jgi:hypothetical protein
MTEITIDWESCRSELATRHEALARYLAGSTAEVRAGRLVISVYSQPAACWLQARFRPVIRAAVRQVTGINLPVHLVST